MSKDKFVYEVKKEDKEDVMQTQFVKKNVNVEFTMQELKDHEERVDGMIREIESKLEVEEATKKNVDANHGDAVALVSQLEPLKQHALFLWLRSQATIAELAPKLENLKKAFDEHNTEVKDIIKQTGWVAPTVHLTMGKDENNKKDKVGKGSSK